MSFHKSLGLPDKNPKTVLIYLVLGTFGLTLASDALSDLVLNRLGKWLETHWGLNPIAFRLLLFGAIASGIVLLIWLTNWWELLTSRPGTIAPEPLKATLPGLIAVASKTPSGVKSAAQAAIEHHWTEGKGNLQHCWIICGGPELEGYARDILSQISGRMPEIAAGEYLLSDRENSKSKGKGKKR
jgi:hypothetical protein